MQVRPPVKHRFGCGPLQHGETPPTVRVFKHRLLQHFMLSLFCKLPVQPMTRIRDMRAAFMVSAVISPARSTCTWRETIHVAVAYIGQRACDMPVWWADDLDLFLGFIRLAS